MSTTQRYNRERVMALWIEDAQGATDDEIRRGVAAARDVFMLHQRDPAYCEAQLVASSNGDDYDAPALQTWYEAESAALTVCFEGWQRQPESASLTAAG